MQEVKVGVIPNASGNLARYLNQLIHEGYHIDCIDVAITVQYATVTAVVTRKGAGS
jgi:hypothetical protein